jgi:hypothetical protein
VELRFAFALSSSAPEGSRVFQSPCFADYLLLVLLAPSLCAARLDDASPVDLATANPMDFTGMVHGRLGANRWGLAGLEVVDCCAIVALRLPKSLPLFSTGATLDTLMNPLILFGYVILALRPRPLHPG